MHLTSCACRPFILDVFELSQFFLKIVFLCRALEIILNQKRPQYIKAKEKTSHQIKKVDMAKKKLRDHVKVQAKQEEGKRELEVELAEIDKAWRAFEKKVEEEAQHLGREVLLEESQVNFKANNSIIFRGADLDYKLDHCSYILKSEVNDSLWSSLLHYVNSNLHSTAYLQCSFAQKWREM